MRAGSGGEADGVGVGAGAGEEEEEGEEAGNGEERRSDGLGLGLWMWAEILSYEAHFCRARHQFADPTVSSYGAFSRRRRKEIQASTAMTKIKSEPNSKRLRLLYSFK